MKPDNSSENSGALNSLLREWKVDSSLSPRFGEQVWRRIERGEIPALNPVTLLKNWIAQTMTRPSFALSYATVLLLAGLTVGFWHGRTDSRQTAETFKARYVQMLDPYQTPRR